MKTTVEPEPHAIDAAPDVAAGQALRSADSPVPAQASLPGPAVLSTQRILGNRATRRILTAGVLQPKLTIGAPDDIYEKEADEVAEQVMSSDSVLRGSTQAAPTDSDDDDNLRRSLGKTDSASRTPAVITALQRIPLRKLQQTLGNRALARLLQEALPAPAIPELRRKCSCGGGSEEECPQCRMKRLALQRLPSGGDAGLEAPPIVEDVLSTPGQPLAESARKTLEPGFGQDFSQVRVHDGSKPAESASAVNALAYTVGNHIVFGEGQYAPGTDDGNHLLAHELTHTIQQTGGTPLPAQTTVPEASPDTAGRAMSVSQPGPYEVEADRAAHPIITNEIRLVAPPNQIASVLQAQRLYGNRVVQLHLRTMRLASPLNTRPAAGAAPDVQCLSLDDVIPDAILNPIKSLVSQVTGFGTGVTSKSDTAASGAQSEAETAADKVDTETGDTVSAEQSKGETAETGVQTQSANAAATTESAKASGETQASQINGAVPVAEHATDPVKSATQPPPPSKLPGGDPAAPKPAADTWNCDEASILNKVSSVSKSVIDGLTKVVKAVVPESVLNFAQQGIAKLQSAIGTIKQKVEAAEKAVTEWIGNKLKPVKDAINTAVQVASD